MENNKLLLHTCCAVCGAYICELLKEKFPGILIYFYNPNIQPEEEYEKRKESVIKLAEIYNLKFQEGEYEKDKWFEAVKGMENEPEGGKRCLICFEIRLKRTVEFAKNNGFKNIATTLSLSPFKDEKIINKMGKEIVEKENIGFIEFNQNKKENWQKTKELAKKFNFYHQKYCGCAYSNLQKR